MPKILPETRLQVAILEYRKLAENSAYLKGLEIKYAFSVNAKLRGALEKMISLIPAQCFGLVCYYDTLDKKIYAGRGLWLGAEKNFLVISANNSIPIIKFTPGSVIVKPKGVSMPLYCSLNMTEEEARHCLKQYKKLPASMVVMPSWEDILKNVIPTIETLIRKGGIIP